MNNTRSSIMEYKNNDDVNMRQVMENQFPGVVSKLKEFEATFVDDNLYIYIGDGGRWAIFHAEIRKRVSSENKGWTWPDHESPSVQALENELRNIIKTTCYRCGAKITHRLVSKKDEYVNLCDFCYAKELKNGDRIKAFAILNMEAHDLNKTIDIPRIKIRLINEDGKVFYDLLSHLYFKDGSFYISNENAFMEKVYYAGYYLGFRDRNGEMIYHGDIVIAKLKNDRPAFWNGYRAFWGMALIIRDNELVLDPGGWGSLPYLLSWATEYEVVTNIFKNIKNIDGVMDYSQRITYDRNDYEDLCRKRAKKLGWHRSNGLLSKLKL